ncbi:glutamic acid-rich protein isoform X2 [Tachysurus fulvidraco]|uniref:glutamic acid-rich protein isoform X2 n=1 Tax=Tachysurus fulvidraco TaxID=1234273 RepID=UPI001FEEB25B|nr:glutamic acid-rich protein isoform X2 [Tachysurus fulvidraco]
MCQSEKCHRCSVPFHRGFSKSVNLLICIAVVQDMGGFAITFYKQRWRAEKDLKTVSMVTQLQNELQELSERERRARHHNQKLLQDFQRAQNTLSDLVARTEAMNTIRMEYERFLEENFPKWQQKLQEKRLSEQQMMIEQHLKACTLRTDEEGQRKGYKQNMQGNFPSTWLTQSPIPVTEPEHGISKNSKNTQNIQVWNSSLLDPSLLSGSPVFLQDHNSSDHLRQYPNSCAFGCGTFNVRVKCPNDCPSWSHLSLTNDGKSRREEKLILKQQDASANSQGENRHMQKQRKKVNSSVTKPVNISTSYRDTSENSHLYAKAVKRLPTEGPTTRNKRIEEKQTHNTRKGVVSEGSCSVSDSQSVSSHNGRKSAFKTSNVTNYPKQLVKENKHESNLIEEKHTSNCCTVKTGGMKRYGDDTEEEEEILIPEEKRVNELTNRVSIENQGNRASLYEARDKNREVVERYREQDSIDEEEEETLRSNMSVKESLLEEVNSVRGSETEGGGAGEEKEEDGVRGDEDEKSRSSGQMNKEDINESEQEGNYGDVLKSGSERSIQDSLRELYKDDTEDDLAEEQEEEDDDDNVIVEKSSPWTCHLAAKDYMDDDDEDDDDDDDDDIEGLLAPQNKSLQHQ